MQTYLPLLLASLLLFTEAKTQTKAIATLGSGCFWCTEAVYERVEGVISVQSGYSGGHTKNPTYKEVCAETTGHAEVIQLVYDPAIISYATILEIFFKTHDPTQLNRQGNDVGTQYRSVIFYHSPEQLKVATEIKNRLEKEGIWEKPIVTAIETYTDFYQAELSHQDYYENNPSQGYCRYVITPKIEKFEKVFEEYLRR
ncbi:MAG: peptide-methionine (S)-S-oxide reductase MsrA [Bacteroidota bacterium]|nr:MAG: peptide-methionine (S)-S-oxide reductase MsrA [Bacteroidota bacterium]